MTQQQQQQPQHHSLTLITCSDIVHGYINVFKEWLCSLET